MQPIRDNHPLKHLFSGLVEHTFQAELGLCDPALADYVADLLVTFTHVDEMVIARDAAGRPIAEISEIIANFELEGADDDGGRRRFLHRRIGDYTLFWSGVFPEGMGRSSGPTWRDLLVDYISFGKRSYAIASELTPVGEVPDASLLHRLSEDFEVCAHGLGLVRLELGSSDSGDGKLEIIY